MEHSWRELLASQQPTYRWQSTCSQSGSALGVLRTSEKMRAKTVLEQVSSTSASPRGRVHRSPGIQNSECSKEVLAAPFSVISLSYCVHSVACSSAHGFGGCPKRWPDYMMSVTQSTPSPSNQSSIWDCLLYLLRPLRLRLPFNSFRLHFSLINAHNEHLNYCRLASLELCVRGQNFPEAARIL